jgi:hypothetical protein
MARTEYDNSLDTITDQISNYLGQRIILHGIPGFGKTSWAAQIPDCVFLMSQGETGLLTLMKHRQLEKVKHFPKDFETWNKVRSTVKELSVRDHPFRCLNIDTLNGLARMCMAGVCQTSFGGNWEKFGDYGAGMKNVYPEWDSFLNDLTKLTKKMSIVSLCHSNVKTFKDPKGANYDRWIPNMPEGLWEMTNGWADLVLFGEIQTRNTETNLERKGKATTSGERILRCVFNPAFDAKHRHGLPDMILCGKSAKSAWEKFSAALRKGMERRQDEDDEEEDDDEEVSEEEQDETDESSDGREEASDDEEPEPERQRQRANGNGKRTKRTK